MNLHTRIGGSLGNVPDMPAAQQIALFETIAAYGGFALRTSLKWTDGHEPDWAKFDATLALAQQHQIEMIWELHTAVAGGGSYAIPDIARYGETVDAVVSRYVPLGCKRYEIWNEGNTQTGNCGGKMTASVNAQILMAGSASARAAAARLGQHIRILGPTLGGVAITYLNQLLAAEPRLLSALDVFTSHLYASEDPTLPGGATEPHRWMTVPSTLFPILDSHGGAGLRVAFSEGGYSGQPAPHPPNCVTPDLQAQYLTQTIQAMRATGRVAWWTLYHPRMTGAKYQPATGYNDGFWQDGLSLADTSGALRPAGLAVKALA